MRFRFADCVLDAERFELSRGGQPVAVQPKVLDLLLFLLRQGDRTVTKRELLGGVWPGVATGETSLTRAVSFARTALGESERDARIILTVRGRGYRIGVPVALEHAAAAPPESDFVGRDAELAHAEAALAAAAGGRGQLLLVTGEPGIGKTRLAEEIEARARAQHIRGRWARCHEGERERAYWPWEQILRTDLAEWDADEAHAVVGEAGAAAVAELVPELRQRLPELPRPAADAERARARLFDATLALLGASAARAPLLLVFDDLHCADEPSLRLLGYAARAFAAQRVLVVATYRDEGASASPALVRALAELARGQPARRTLVLAGLDAPNAERWIRRALGEGAPEQLVRACFARSEGNPLFLRELVHWLEASGASEIPAEAPVPEGVRHVLRQRTASLTAACRTTLEAAAVLGREFPTAVLATLCGLEPPALLEQLEAAEAAGFVAAAPGQPGGFRFTHGLIADTLYEGLSAVRRARLHERAGEALEARYRPRPLAPTREPLPIRGVYLAELAHHFTAALPSGDAAKALDYCERAGDHALGLLAYEEAERHFERALRVLEATHPADEERRARLAASRSRAAARAGLGSGARQS